MKKIYLIAIIPLILGIGCLIAFKMIGSHVAPDGTLVEPFALIPIGWLLIIIGIVSSIVLFVRSFFKKE